MTAAAINDPAEAARFMNRYAHKYHAGAFATPSRGEMTAISARRRLHSWPGVLATSARLHRDSQRGDWTGRQYTIPGGTEIITHLAAEPGAAIPDLSRFGRIYAYAEDAQLTGALAGQGREICAVRISAASEIINCWGRDGSGHAYPPWDTATLVKVGEADVAAAAEEARALAGWHDDFPFYSDGTWSALSLRGFNPADPTWGVKPSEMSRAWHAEHPGAAVRYARCDWTVLADRAPACRALTEAVAGGWELERVRLLRMAARPDHRTGKLARHTDITDRNAGTAEGCITRFHVPLVTHPAITMTGWELDGRQVTEHLPAGQVWYLDARKPHAVANPSRTDRIHLVIDVRTDRHVRAAITAGTAPRRAAP